MITGELKNKIDSIWEIFWIGSLTNPLDVIEQMTYDLSINKYKQTEYVAVEYPPTEEIMLELRELEMKIGEEMDELERLLGL